MSEMLTRKQAAEMLGVSVRWLEEHRADGPRFYKPSHRIVRYKKSDVEAWLNQRLVRSC